MTDQQARPQVSARFNSVHRSPCAMVAVGMDHPTFRNGGGGAPHLRPLVSRHLHLRLAGAPIDDPVRVRTKGGKKRANHAAKDEPKAPSFGGPACCGMRTTVQKKAQWQRSVAHAAPSPAGVAYCACMHASALRAASGLLRTHGTVVHTVRFNPRKQIQLNFSLTIHQRPYYLRHIESFATCMKH